MVNFMEQEASLDNLLLESSGSDRHCFQCLRKDDENAEHGVRGIISDKSAETRHDESHRDESDADTRMRVFHHEKFTRAFETGVLMCWNDVVASCSVTASEKMNLPATERGGWLPLVVMVVLSFV
jgi:hypothetical protein